MPLQAGEWNFTPLHGLTESAYFYLTDILECSETPNPCSQYCAEEAGSFSCFCNETGYQLDVDGKTCIGKRIDIFSGEATKSNWFCLSSEKWSTLKEKTNAPPENKFLPFRVDPFSEGDWCTVKQTGSDRSCLPCQKNDSKIY